MGKNNQTSFNNNPEQLAKAVKNNTKPEAKQKAALTQSIQRTVAPISKNKRISPEVSDYIRESLLKPDKNGHTYMMDFIDNFLTMAKKDPESKPAQMLASGIFDAALLNKLDDEINKQMNRDIAFADYNIRKTLYDKQMEVYDNVQDKSLLVINSRRTGKTELSGRLLAKRVLRPNQHCVYINRSFDAAVRQLQKPLETALAAASVTYRGTINGGKIEFDNGSWILVIGNNNAADVNKLRGEKLALVIIDECGHQRHLRELVQEVISPATIDYADSQIIYTGTPPRTKTSFIKQLWDNPKVRKYHWTFMDNPFLPNRDNVIAEACDMFGVSPDSMFIRREYFGDMDAYDDEATYIKHYTTFDQLPNKIWDYGWIGVDWGYEDKAAVVAAVADKQDRKMYIVKDWSEAKKATSEICTKVKDFDDWMKKSLKLKHPPMVICDTNDKNAMKELYTTYHIQNVFAAYKYDKDMALDDLAEWFNAGTISFDKSCAAIMEDADNMIWKRDEDTDKILHELDDEAYHGNAMFATLYISRQFAFDVIGSVNAKAKAAQHILGSKQILNEYGVYEDEE